MGYEIVITASGGRYAVRTKIEHERSGTVLSGMLFEQETKRNILANLFDKESRFGVIDCRVDGSRHPPHALRITGHRQHHCVDQRDQAAAVPVDPDRHVY